MTDDDLTLPGGWYWATNIHDVAKGLAVSKVWWRNAKPFVRVKLYAVPALDRSAGAIRGTIEVALAERDWAASKRGPNGSRRVVHTMKWEYVMDIPSLPNEPTAAAVCVELDYPQWEQTITSHGAKGGLLWCDTEA